MVVHTFGCALVSSKSIVFGGSRAVVAEVVLDI